jgi:hypothetical protein
MPAAVHCMRGADHLSMEVLLVQFAPVCVSCSVRQPKWHVGNGTCGERGDDGAGQKSQSKESTFPRMCSRSHQSCGNVEVVEIAAAAAAAANANAAKVAHVYSALIECVGHTYSTNRCGFWSQRARVAASPTSSRRIAPPAQAGGVGPAPPRRKRLQGRPSQIRTAPRARPPTENGSKGARPVR